MAPLTSRGLVAGLLVIASGFFAGCGKGGGNSIATAAMPSSELPGWHRVLADDFSGAALNRGWTVYAGQPAGDPAGWFDAGHVTVGGGLLTIRGSYDTKRKKWVTGGLSTQRSLVQSYGKY